jgi:hypothetical protein
MVRDEGQRVDYLSCNAGRLYTPGNGPGSDAPPRNKQGAAMLSVSVDEYDIADVRHLFGERTA